MTPIEKMLKAKKYNPVERRNVRSEIRRQKLQGLNYIEIAIEMNKGGFRKPDGSYLEHQFIASQAKACGLAKRRQGRRWHKAPLPEVVEPVKSVGIDIDEIWKLLSPDKKKQAILAVL